MNLILLIPFLIIFILTRNVAGLCDPMTGRILDSDYKALGEPVERKCGAELTEECFD